MIKINKDTDEILLELLTADIFVIGGGGISVGYNNDTLCDFGAYNGKLTSISSNMYRKWMPYSVWTKYDGDKCIQLNYEFPLNTETAKPFVHGNIQSRVDRISVNSNGTHELTFCGDGFYETMVISKAELDELFADVGGFDTVVDVLKIYECQVKGYIDGYQ